MGLLIDISNMDTDQVLVLQREARRRADEWARTVTGTEKKANESKKIIDPDPILVARGESLPGIPCGT